MPLRKSCAALLCATLTGGALAQTPSPPQAPLIRKTARLVEVSVVARDATGKPVTGLTRDDFELFDENTIQVITTFIVDSRTAQPAAAQSLARNTFTNRLDLRGSIPASVSIVLLDALNTATPDLSYARDQVLKSLWTLQPQDRVAVYALGQHLYRLHDFTGDVTALRRVVQAYQREPSPQLADSHPLPADVPAVGRGAGDVALRQDTIDWLNAVNGRMADYLIADRVRRTIAALEMISERVAAIPGRKNLIWVSGGFPLSYGHESETPQPLYPIDPTRFYTDVNRTARTLNNAGLVIYPVDAHGLFDAYNQNPNLNRAAQRATLRDAPPVPDTRVNTSDRDSMLLLAQRTGGKAFFNTNDLEGAIRKAVDDSAASYTLAYSPDHGQWFGQWRKIKVRVKRPGLSLRYRPGYYAMTEEPATRSDRSALTLAAASSPLEATALGLTARSEFADAARTALNLRIEVDSRALWLQREQGNRFLGAFDISFAQFDRDGKRLRYLTQAVDMKLSSRSYSAMHREGLEIERKLELAPGATEVRVAVRDSSTGMIGSVVIPLQQIDASPNPR